MAELIVLLIVWVFILALCALVFFAYLLYKGALGWPLPSMPPWVRSRTPGWQGEQQFLYHVCKRLPPTEYFFLHDVLIPVDGGTSQVDFVILSRYGLWVIETKDYKGWIFGRERDRFWTQAHAGHRGSPGPKFRFQNPLHQNYGHIKAVCAVTGLVESECHSLVVFTGNAVFRTDRPANVVYLSEAFDFIVGEQRTLFSDEKLHEIRQRLEWARIPSTPENVRRHIQGIEHRRSITASSLENAHTNAHSAYWEWAPLSETEKSESSVIGEVESTVTREQSFVRCNNCRCVFPRGFIRLGQAVETSDGRFYCDDCLSFAVEAHDEQPLKRVLFVRRLLGVVLLTMFATIVMFPTCVKPVRPNSSRVALRQESSPTMRHGNVSETSHGSGVFPSEREVQEAMNRLVFKGWIQHRGVRVILIGGKSYLPGDRLMLKSIPDDWRDMSVKLAETTDKFVVLTIENADGVSKRYRVAVPPIVGS